MQISKHAAARPYLSTMLKSAGVWDSVAKQLPTEKSLEAIKSMGMIAAVALPVVTSSVGVATHLYDKMTEASRKAQAFKGMLSENPHLQAHDQVVVQRYFNTLHNLNPQLANDPTVAASFVNNLVMTGTNPAMPHRDLYAKALEAQGRGGGGGGRPTESPWAAFGQSLQEVHKAVNDNRLEKVKGELGEHKTTISDLRSSLTDATRRGDKGMRASTDHYRKRTRAEKKLEEVERRNHLLNEQIQNMRARQNNP